MFNSIIAALIMVLFVSNLGAWPSVFAEEAYRHGWRAWKDGNRAEARRQWARYLAVSCRDPIESLLARYQDVKARHGEIPPPAVDVPPVPVVEPTPWAKPKRSRSKTDSASRRPNKKTEAAKLMRRAKRAERNGQLDDALKLYRQAAQLNPGPEEQEARGRLEKVLE